MWCNWTSLVVKCYQSTLAPTEACSMLSFVWRNTTLHVKNQNCWLCGLVHCSAVITVVVDSMEGSSLCQEIVKRASSGFVYSEAVARYIIWLLMFYRSFCTVYFSIAVLTSAIRIASYVFLQSYSQSLTILHMCHIRPVCVNHQRKTRKAVRCRK